MKPTSLGNKTRNRNRPSQKCSMIQEVLNTTVAWMNTGAQLWWKCVKFSNPKIVKKKKKKKKFTVVPQFGAYWVFMWYLVTMSCIFDSVRFFLNSTVQTTW